MGAAIVRVARRLPYGSADLCALVSDIRSYPNFIPWLKTLTILQERWSKDTWIATARAVVGWGAITETFTTEVRAGRNQVDVSLVSGPFKSLTNSWKFAPDSAAGGEGTMISFYVAFEFKNAVLQGLANLNRDLAAQRIMAAFEQEAARRFRTPV